MEIDTMASDNGNDDVSNIIYMLTNKGNIKLLGKIYKGLCKYDENTKNIMKTVIGNNIDYYYACNGCLVDSEPYRLFISWYDKIELAYYNFNKITDINIICKILRDVEYNTLTKYDNFKYYKLFISCININHIVYYMNKYKRAIPHIIRVFGIFNIAGMITTKEQVEPFVKYEPEIAECVYNKSRTNQDMSNYIMNLSINELVAGSRNKIIHQIIIENIWSIQDTLSEEILLKIFWAYEDLYYNEQCNFYHWCPYIRFANYLLKFRDFQYNLYKIRGRNDFIYKDSIDNGPGVMYGIAIGDVDKIKLSMQHIKENIDTHNPEELTNKDITIKLPIELLSKCTYKGLIVIYKILKLNSSNHSIYIDAESVYNIQYLIANPECNICFEETTDIFIPNYMRDKDNTHNCSFITCNTCKKEYGDNCKACGKLLV